MAQYRGLSPNGVAESRRAPRIELMERIHGHLTSVDVPVLVREISLGGLSVQAALRFPVGAVHEFRLTLGDLSTVMVRGRVVHCTPREDEKGQLVYNTGIEFLEDQPVSSPKIPDLVSRMTSSEPAKVKK